MSGNQKIELAPCPFCGGCGTIVKKENVVHVECSSCFAAGERFLVGPDICARDEAVKAWNRRITAQKQGCWMLDGSDGQWRCSECGTHAASWDRTKETGGLPMVCHGCGAKMDGAI